MVWKCTITLFTLFIVPAFLCAQDSLYTESDYANFIQTLIGGQREVTVESGRIDLLTETHAFEIEWAPKWKEAIGQALWYALQTNTQPGIILILKGKEEYKYFVQLNSALQYAGLTGRFSVLRFPDDFRHLLED